MKHIDPKHLAEQHDKMGRLIAWIVDDRHDIPKVSSETKKYIHEYMQEILTEGV